MSKPKFTPGPWYRKDHLIYRRPIYEMYEHGGWVAGEKPIANVFKGWEENGYPVEANARLIAAAPELLEALEDLIYTASRLWDEVKPIKDTDAITATHPIIEAAKFALAKAKGETI